jgi:hypothetical protein
MKKRKDIQKIKVEPFSKFTEYCNTRKKIGAEISEDFKILKASKNIENDGILMVEETYYKIPTCLREAIMSVQMETINKTICQIHSCVKNEILLKKGARM